MHLRAPFDTIRAGLLLALGLTPGVACGGAVTDASPDAGPTTPRFPCRGDTEHAGGFFECADGRVHRVAIRTCPTRLPRAAKCEVPGGSPSFVVQCKDDRDCKEHPNGTCDFRARAGCFCNYGCTSDAECGKGSVCICGDDIGKCVGATCASDADCRGELCASYLNRGCPGAWAFACTTPADACAVDADCGRSGANCGIEDGKRRCYPLGCIEGRPFLVRAEARVAPTTSRRDWSFSVVTPRLDALDPVDRERLASHWTEVAQMEHASIAAFARFSLQLLALGAPADLLERTHAALADETLHARLAFGLASAYAGRPVGPASLSLEGALDVTRWDEILRMAVREGCVGETIAALEAHESAAYARDEGVRAVLERVAEDETRHAELAFRFVRWMVEQNGEGAREVVRQVLAKALVDAEEGGEREEPVGRSGEGSERSLEHGLLDARRRREVRARAVRKVVAPCLRVAADVIPAVSPTGTPSPGLPRCCS